ncbi:MAG: SDR family oxidoreductase [Myxococcota bacterium]|jgi:UDP-glucose 4-epimerase|nr:SDR family oxidoreductase [Myxococcota bacterium]
MRARSVLVTGASGCVGRQVVRALAAAPDRPARIVATDVREVPAGEQLDGVEYRRLDITEPAAFDLLGELAVDTVVHLAAIVTPPPGDTRALQYAVDVDGTRHVLEACVRFGVERFVYTSSGAAYGYHADSPAVLREDDALRGNEVFAYSDHKRLVEELLARYRTDHPALEQVIFRVSTVLGADVANQITAMFERRLVLGLWGAETPFCFIWDEDAATCLVQAVRAGPPGVYNLTGDGVMSLREIAGLMERRYVSMPVGLVRRALAIAKARQWAPYGPEQVLFLQHRPVLDNTRLKQVFGWTPSHTSREAFEVYRRSRFPHQAQAARVA